MKDIYEARTEVALESLTPLGDFVLVKRLPDADREGSIHVPESARNKERGLRRGVVMAVGPGDRRKDGGRHALGCKIGDEVIFPRVPANDIRLNGEVYTFIHEEQHIWAVIEEEGIPLDRMRGSYCSDADAVIGGGAADTFGERLHAIAIDKEDA